MRGEADEGAEFAEVGGGGEGEGDESNFGAAGLRGPGSLREVLRDQELAGYLGHEMHVLERFVGGEAIGIEHGVGNRNPVHLGTGEDVERDGLGG